jgi:long-chain acyl-CoA synthetase
MTEPQTLPQYFLDLARRYGAKKVAMRQKKLGIWKEYSWAESLEQLQSFALGLSALGLQREDKVCILGDNDPEFYWAEIGAMAMGGIACGIFTDATPPEIQYMASFADAKFVLAKDQEQVDKLLAIRAQLPLVQKVIYWDERGLWNYKDDWLMSFQAVQQLGRKLAQQEPQLFESTVALGRADEVAIFSYTSGTTGAPKAAMVMHKNFIEGQKAGYQTDPRYDTDEYLSFLPLAWITEHGIGIAAHCLWGIIVNFPEEPETVRENLREICPHAIFYSPRIWESVVSLIQVRMQDANWLNRKLYDIFMPIGEKVAELQYAKKAIPSSLQFLYRLGDALIYRPLRENLGLQRARFAISAGSVLSPDVLRFFHTIGIPVRQLYGSTEAGFATIQRADDIKAESVGKPFPSVAIRISPQGEIQVKGDGVFKGYYKNPQATAEKIIDGGWYCTGDAGHTDNDGHLIYLDRVTELLELAGGEKYSPQYIEGRLKFSPYIKDVMTVGGRTRPFLSALVNIDFENVGKWAEARGLGYTTYVDLSQKPEVYELIRKDVERVNKTLPDKARIRKFVLLHKEFDADEGELTRTRKLRRNVVEQRYADILHALYGDGEAVNVRAEVKYRDGRTGVVETAIRVAALAS